MTTLTDRIPKCMLPIADVPMFWYPLNFLQRNSVNEVLLVLNERHVAEVKQLLASGQLPSLDDLSIEYVSLTNASEDWGTADVLRHIESKIKKDFIVVSGDFVSDMNLGPLLALHRAESAALTCLLAENVIVGPVPGPKVKRSKSRDFVALSESNQLLFLGSEEDFDEAIPMNSRLFSRFKNVNVTTKFNDCHVYVMKKWILEIVKKERSLSSIKADLIPYLLEQQFTALEPEIAAHVQPDRLTELANLFSFGSSTSQNSPRLRCFAYVITPENGSIIAHVNNIGSYFEVNKAILRFLKSRFSESFPPGLRSDQGGASSSFAESYIHKTAKLAGSRSAGDLVPRADKPIVKRSVVGADVNIAAHTKITNSLIMSGCVIGQGAQITNSILCNEVEVEEGAEITSSIVVNRQKIAANSNIQNEIVAPDDQMDIEE